MKKTLLLLIMLLFTAAVSAQRIWQEEVPNSPYAEANERILGSWYSLEGDTITFSQADDNVVRYMPYQNRVVIFDSADRAAEVKAFYDVLLLEPGKRLVLSHPGSEVKIVEYSFTSPFDASVDGHVAIDLGLPSGTLWAAHNVRAKALDDTGGYFAWGETMDKSTYKPSTYAYAKPGSTDDNYSWSCYNNTDSQTSLSASHDAVTDAWGGSWQLPTRKQLEELIDRRYTQVYYSGHYANGCSGIVVESMINGHKLLLPYTSYKDDKNGLAQDQEVVICMSKELDPSTQNPYALQIKWIENANSLGDLDCKIVSCYERWVGFTARPVSKPSQSKAPQLLQH